MKYVIVIEDGAADYPLKEIDGKTPLKVANKPDSEDICFVPDGDYKKFLENNSNIKPNKGNIVNAINENVGRINSVENNVNNVQTALGEIIKTKLSNGVSQTVSANTSGSFDVPLSISGYTLVGIITFNITGKNSSNCSVQGVTINASSTGATIRFKNLANASVDWTCTAKGLFIRNDLV